MIAVDLGAFKPALQGQHITGRVDDDKLVPYYDRAAIDAGALKTDSVIAYVDDPVEAFFLEVQGSGLIDLEDGTQFIASYAGGNGQPYTAIGKTLIAEGYFAPGTANALAIKAWLRDHPGDARRILESNASVVFFKRSDKQKGPVGAAGRALIPTISLAVDRKIMPLGTLLWLDAAPIEPDTPRFQTLLVADDTGGAIKGVVRGDIYFGPGAEAEREAGLMQSRGRYWALQPIGN
jgi:membrane-bound lytic murein transglycosylase A